MLKGARVATIIVTLLHVWFFVLEAVLWNTPFGHRAMRMTPEQALATEVLARNQGAYNAVLAAGLVWALRSPAEERYARSRFFLVAIVVMGVVGAVTAARLEILALQTAPALVALVALTLGTRRAGDRSRR